MKRVILAVGLILLGQRILSMAIMTKLGNYTLVRIIDKCGQIGGKRIFQADLNAPPDLPYLKKSTGVIRAREDDGTLFIVR